MQKETANFKRLIPISKAAKILQLSPDTLRNWEKEGKLMPSRTRGGARRYSLSELLELKKELPAARNRSLVSISKAAQALNVSADTLRNWDKTGLIETDRSKGGARRFSRTEITRLQSELGIKQPTLTKQVIVKTREVGPKHNLPISKVLLRFLFGTAIFFFLLFNFLFLPLDQLKKLTNDQNLELQDKIYKVSANLESMQKNLYDLQTKQAVLGASTTSVEPPRVLTLNLQPGADIAISQNHINDISTLATVFSRGGCNDCLGNSEIKDDLTVSSAGSVSGDAIKSVVGIGVGGTGLSSYNKGEMLFASDNNQLSKLAPGLPGQVLAMSSSGLPQWQSQTKIVSLPEDDSTPNVLEGNYFLSGYNPVTISNFTGNPEAGKVIFVKSQTSLTYDVSGHLIAGTSNLFTNVGDLTAWIWDGHDWTLISWMKNSAIQTGADLAEYYVSQEKLEAGTVVSNNPEGPLMIGQTKKAYQDNLIGVVSTQPGIILGGFAKQNSYPIALAGRVPIKVSLENGPIEAGDYLTSSSTPGVAMKATQPGMVIGKALEGYSRQGTVDRVLVFIQPGLADPTNILANLSFDQAGNLAVPKAKADLEIGKISQIGQISQNNSLEVASKLKSIETEVADLKNKVDSLSLTPPQILLASNSAQISDKQMDLVVSNSFKSLGESSLGSTTIAGDFTINGLMSLSENSINTLGGVLYLQNSPLAKGIDFLNGKVTIDSGGTLKVDQLIVADFKVVSGKISGKAEILPLHKSVEIKNEKIADTSRILVTPTSDSEAILAVTDKKPGLSFTVSTSKIATESAKFDWWMVNEVGGSN